MRKYDIAYVPNGPINTYPAVKLEDMSLEEIIKKYICSCAKANGQVSVCSKCSSPCREGKRAIQLVANQIYNDPPIPLYGGKTLIEKAREENMKRREKMQMSNEEIKKAKRTVSARYDGWWEDSIESGDQTKWLMTNYGLSRTQAKKKIYQYRYNHGLTKEKNDEPVTEEKAVTEITEPVNETAKTVTANDSIEAKLDSLLKRQEEHKKAMERYLELYNNEKAQYELLKQKTDTLCSAMDIINE